MNDLIENDEKRKEMEKNSRSYFESDFFIDNRIKALEEFIQKFITDKYL